MSDLLCDCDQRCKEIRQENRLMTIECTDFELLKGCYKKWVINIKEVKDD